jgi:hypothetical protein
VEGFSGFGMGEGEEGGVEFKLPRAGAIPVKGVAYDGDAETFWVGGVKAELMGPPGDGEEVDAGEVALDSNFLPIGGAHFPVDFVVDLERAVFDVQSEGQVDRSGVAFELALEKCLVTLFGEPFLELNGEVPVGGGGEPKDHQARGVHVESVDRRLGDAARDGDSDAVRYGVELFGAPSGDGEEAARFSDNDDVVILIDDLHFHLSYVGFIGHRL